MHQSRKEQGLERAARLLLQPERHEALLFTWLDERDAKLYSMQDEAASARFQAVKSGRT